MSTLRLQLFLLCSRWYQVEAHRNEYGHLWWLVRGLDHAVVVGLMHARGEDFVELDRKIKSKAGKITLADLTAEQHPYCSRVHLAANEQWLLDYIGWFEAAAPISYSPKDAVE
eukprot:jgi/Ulvmu1/8023/UM004_0260.1